MFRIEFHISKKSIVIAMILSKVLFVHTWHMPFQFHFNIPYHLYSVLNIRNRFTYHMSCKNRNYFYISICHSVHKIKYITIETKKKSIYIVIIIFP